MTSTISKSKYLSGLQCPLLLWVTFNEPSALPPTDATTQAIFDQGHEVGNLAKKLFSDGVEVEFENGFQYRIERTRELVKERKTIFEATFAAEGLYGQADVLVPAGKDKWDLIEVKSSTQVKKINVEDVAFQRYCYETADIKIRNCYLMLINNEYVRRGPIDPEKLFVRHDITENVTLLLPTVAEKIKEMRRIIAGPRPKQLIGAHCNDPYKCALCEKCWDFLPEHNVTELYYAKKQGYDLLQQGILRIADIPSTVKLGAKQTIQQEAIISGETHVDRAQIRAFLKTLEYPLAHLDFETFSDAVPRFDGVKPYQQVAFQYSLHIDNGKKIVHKEFLAESGDPRPALLEALKRDLPEKGSIIAYNASFEIGRLNELAVEFPAHGPWIRAAIARFVDLLVPFRQFAHYHPDQHGSCSIKAVLPALCGTTYDDLEIGKGDEASREYVRVTYGDVSTIERERVRKALLTYCKQDTQAMIDVLKELESVKCR